MFADLLSISSASAALLRASKQSREAERKKCRGNLISIAGIFFIFPNRVRCRPPHPRNRGAAAGSESLAVLQLGPRNLEKRDPLGLPQSLGRVLRLSSKRV